LRFPLTTAPARFRRFPDDVSRETSFRAGGEARSFSRSSFFLNARNKKRRPLRASFFIVFFTVERRSLFGEVGARVSSLSGD